MAAIAGSEALGAAPKPTPAPASDPGRQRRRRPLEVLPPQPPDEPGELEAELKKMLARELHDVVAQQLTAALLELESVKRAQVNRVALGQDLASLQVSLRDVLAKVRELLYDLRGERLREGGLVSSVRDGLVVPFRRRTGIPVRMSVARSWPRRLPPGAAWNLHRCIQEALNNVRLHAGASQVRIALERGAEEEAIVLVEDNGSGMGSEPAGRPTGLGLVGMRERALVIGGEFSIDSAPGRGTAVRITIPKEVLA